MFGVSGGVDGGKFQVSKARVRRRQMRRSKEEERRGFWRKSPETWVES